MPASLAVDLCCRNAACGDRPVDPWVETVAGACTPIESFRESLSIMFEAKSIFRRFTKY
jgi:hypothetical protein